MIFRRLFYMLLFTCAALASLHSHGSPALSFHWEDRFSPAEQRKLEGWVAEVDQALTILTGPTPFTKHIYFHRLLDAGEPVPWANTTRGNRQGVHFHVNPGLTLAAFRADWTASHELSHLLIPYLGRRNAWFAEGFASYMQYQVMAAGGVVAKDELAGIYRQRFERAARRYEHPTLSFIDAAPRLRAARRYPTLYWGGAVYFWNVDRALRARESSLIAVLRRYLVCCRLEDDNLDALITRFDALSGGTVFSEELRRFRREPGFPSY